MGTIRQFVGRSSLGARRVVDLISCGNRHDWSSRSSAEGPMGDDERKVLLADALDTVLITRNEMAASFVAKELHRLKVDEPHIADKLAQVVAELDPVLGRVVLREMLKALLVVEMTSPLYRDPRAFPLLLASVQTFLQKPASSADREMELDAIRLLARWSSDPELGEKIFLAVAVSDQLGSTARCLWCRLVSDSPEVRLHVRAILNQLHSASIKRRLVTSSESTGTDSPDADSLQAACDSPSTRLDGIQMISAALQQEMLHEMDMRDLKHGSIDSSSVVEATPSIVGSHASPGSCNARFLETIRSAITNYLTDWPRAEEALELWKLLASFCLQSLRSTKESLNLVNEFVSLPEPLLDSSDPVVLDAMFESWKVAAVRSSASRILKSSNAGMHISSLIAPIVDHIGKGNLQLRPAIVECWREVVSVAAARRPCKESPPLLDTWRECFQPMMVCVGAEGNDRFSQLVISLYIQMFRKLRQSDDPDDDKQSPPGQPTLYFLPNQIADLAKWKEDRSREACNIVRRIATSALDWDSPCRSDAMDLFKESCQSMDDGTSSSHQQSTRSQLVELITLLRAISQNELHFQTKRDFLSTFLTNAPSSVLRSQVYTMHFPLFFNSQSQSDGNEELAQKLQIPDNRMLDHHLPIVHFVDIWIKAMTGVDLEDSATLAEEEIAVLEFTRALKIICDGSQTDFPQCFNHLLQLSVLLDDAWRKQDQAGPPGMIGTRLVLRLWACLASEFTQLLEKSTLEKTRFSGNSGVAQDGEHVISVALGMLAFPMRIMLFSTRSASQNIQLSPSSTRRPPGIIVAEWSCLYTTLANTVVLEESSSQLAHAICSEIHSLTAELFQTHAPSIPPLLFEFILCCTRAVLCSVSKVDESVGRGENCVFEKAVLLVSNSVHVGAAILSHYTEGGKESDIPTANLVDVQRACRLSLDSLGLLSKKLPRAEDVAFLSLSSYSALERLFLKEQCAAHVARFYQSTIDGLNARMNKSDSLPNVLGLMEPVLKSMMRMNDTNIPIWAAYFVREVEHVQMAGWPQMQKLAVRVLQKRARVGTQTRHDFRDSGCGRLQFSSSPPGASLRHDLQNSKKTSLRERLVQEHRAKEQRLLSARNNRLLGSIEGTAPSIPRKQTEEDVASFTKYRQLDGETTRMSPAAEARPDQGRALSPQRNQVPADTLKESETPLAGILKKRKSVDEITSAVSPSLSTAKRVKFAAAETKDVDDATDGPASSPDVAKTLFVESPNLKAHKSVSNVLEILKSDVDELLSDSSISTENLVTLYKSLRFHADLVFDRYHEKVSVVRSKIDAALTIHSK